jgi:hypothetical protein
VFRSLSGLDEPSSRSSWPRSGSRLRRRSPRSGYYGFGGGINWYWNENIKVVLDYYHTHFDGGKSGGTGNRQTEDVLITRLQLNL